MKKLVRESLFEKFIEDSDPIYDMGIGVFSPREFSSREEMVNFLFKHIREITGYKGNLREIIHKYGNRCYIEEPYKDMLINYAEKFIINYNIGRFSTWKYRYWMDILATKIDKEGD